MPTSSGIGVSTVSPGVFSQDAEKAEREKQAADEAKWEAKIKAARDPSDITAKQRASLHERFSKPTGPVTKTLGDGTIARNKMKRKSSKHAVDAPKPVTAVSSEPVREEEYDPQKQYLVTSKHQATLMRAVGSKRHLFQQLADEVLEEKQGMGGGLQPTVYVQILTWSFYNRKSGSDFVKLMTEVSAHGLSATGYFNVFELPVEIESEAVPDVLRQDVRYMSVAVGTTEQFVQLHSSYDLLFLLNSGKTKQLEKQRGIKHLSGIYQCAKAGQVRADAIIEEWNKEAYCNIEVAINRKLAVPGGCETIAWYTGGGDADVGGSGNDLLLSVGMHTLEPGVPDCADAFNYYDIVRGEYRRFAMPLSDNALFSGICTPIDFEYEHPHSSSGPVRFLSVSMHRASTWLDAKQAAGSDAASEMDGVSKRKVFYFGAGAHTSAMRSYVGRLQGIQGLSAGILTGAVYIESPEDSAQVLGLRTEAVMHAQQAAAKEAADAEAAKRSAAAAAAEQARADARAADLAKPPLTKSSIGRIFAKKERVLLGHVSLGIEIKAGVLTVQVNEAKGLRAEDTNGFSDPFVQINLSSNAKKVQKTKTIKKSLNPEWNETLTIASITAQQIAEERLEVNVWDWDRVSGNDFMGGCSWSLQELTAAGKVDDWFTLFETDNAKTMNLVPTDADKVAFKLPSAADKAKAVADAAEAAERQAAETLAAAAAKEAKKAARKASKKGPKKASTKKGSKKAAAPCFDLVGFGVSIYVGIGVDLKCRSRNNDDKCKWQHNPQMRNLYSGLPPWRNGTSLTKWEPHGDNPCACRNRTDVCAIRRPDLPGS
eukprot:gene12120-19563_t